MLNHAEKIIDSRSKYDTYICEITTSTAVLETGIIKVVYGLRMFNSDPRLSHIKGEYARIDSISPDLEDVRRLKSAIEELSVYPVHLRDVVEDYFS